MNYIEKEEEIEMDFFNDNENSDEKYKLLRNGEESWFNDSGDKNNSNNLIDFFSNKRVNNTPNSNNTTIHLNNSNNEDFNLCFFPNKNKDENNNSNNKKLSKESIEILNNFISKELLITSRDKTNLNSNNKIFNNIKEIKNNLINLENEMNTFFKRPFMRKNANKLRKVGKVSINEEEKNQYYEKKDEIIKFINNNIKSCI